MCAIKTSHDLQTGADGPPPGPASRSSYSYLFPDLADAPNSGRFNGTDDGGTIQRLKDFEIACRQPYTPIPLPGLTIDLPAAYTYFGQFLNHDISAPVGGLLQDLTRVDPVGIVGSVDHGGLEKGWRADVATILQHFANEQVRPLTLASLYGDGPEVAGLYQTDGRRFHLAQTSVTPAQAFRDQKIDPDAVFHACCAPDIPRKDHLPLIADQRNDGNLILSQLHLAFMLCHNKAVAALEACGTPGDEVFATVRQLVTLHYHWLILNDFLPALLSKTVLARPLAQWQPRPLPAGTVPMEFTTAAFRFGHSMVGRAYDFNANFGQGGRISTAGASLLQLFAFTSQGNMEDPRGPPCQLPDHWVIDWDRLTRNQAPDAGPDPVSGKAERFDLDFAPDMLNVAGDAQVVEQGSILFRNLLRGFHRRIPFGQHLAREYGVTLLSRAALRAAMPQHRSPSGDYPIPPPPPLLSGFWRKRRPGSISCARRR